MSPEGSPIPTNATSEREAVHHSIVITESIDPELLEKLEAEIRSPADAIKEFIDNSLDARIPGQPLVFYINLDLHPTNYSKSSLLLSDRGGTGMGIDDLPNLYRWGRTGPEGRIGRHGIGVKTAIAILADEATLTCSKAGSHQVISINDPAVRERPGGQLKEFIPLIQQRIPGHGFVQISLTKLREENRINPEELRVALGITYQPAINGVQYAPKRRNGYLTILFNGKEIIPPAIPFQSEPEPFTLELPVEGYADGFLALLPEKSELIPPGIKPGISVFVYDRLIEDGWFPDFIHPQSTPGMEQIYGQLYIESDKVGLMLGKVGLTKDAIYELLEEEMHKIMEPMVKAHIKPERTTRVSPLEAGAKREAFDIYRRGLERLGITGKGIKPPVRIEVEKEEKVVPIKKEAGEAREVLPLTVAPREKVGKRRRIPEVAFETFNLQDLTTRSRVVKTDTGYALEIGIQYPAYLKHRAVGVESLRLYILETAILELAKRFNYLPIEIQDKILTSKEREQLRDEVDQFSLINERLLRKIITVGWKEKKKVKRQKKK